MWPFNRKQLAPQGKAQGQQGPSLAASDLPVPIYLNQRIVFDLLATFEDGFSQLTNVRTSAAASDSAESGGQASLGTGNAFALLGVSLGASTTRRRGTTSTTELAAEKVHTPTSLFAKLRSLLRDRGLLRELQSSGTSLENGQFIEFRAVLRKNPLVDTMEGFRELMRLALSFSEDSPAGPQPQKRAQGKPADRNRVVMAQMEAMVQALTSSGSVDLIAEAVGGEGVKAVLVIEPSYFNDPSMSEIIDGEFRVLGKITRVIPADSDETINLLRKTSFGRFQREIIDQLTQGFSGATSAGLNFPDVETEVPGPAVQIIPIAIFS